jgi:roadblock/LC7 domain-containing protein
MLQIRRMVVDGSYYVDGLLLSYMADLPASIMVATTAGAIMAAVIARALYKSDYSFWLVFSNPAKGTIFHNGITW